MRAQNVTKLCKTKNIITVNRKFPGPRIISREDDRLVIKVVNHVSDDITIHWWKTAVDEVGITDLTELIEDGVSVNWNEFVVVTQRVPLTKRFNDYNLEQYKKACERGKEGSEAAKRAFVRLR